MPSISKTITDAEVLLKERKNFSRTRLGELSNRFLRTAEVARFENLCIYATGSYARHEASANSDIDLFFVHTGSSHSVEVPSRLDELRLFARVIEIGESMDLPPFSNDGEYLKILYLDDMLSMLGGPADDFHNYFTARMLLLLESTPLANNDRFREMSEAVIESYFRDYPDHSKEFRPVFLINDILRFWKTLCLNYEHRRNRPEDDLEKKRQQQVKNFKLKFSRLLTCFGTIVAICSMPPPIDGDNILTLTRMTPLERFLSAIKNESGLAGLRREVLQHYAWFMEHTALTTEKLREHFEEAPDREAMFDRADSFGRLVYDALDYLAERNSYRRYLVI